MSEYTPMMEQYLKIKNEYKHCLVFFRLGDFYELFFDDAYIASKELDITLTGKECGADERAPMCGVPYHSADGYIAKLIEKGYKVAVCEQTENPKQTKTLVKREVVRIVTPGTVTDPNTLDSVKNNYIAAVYEDSTAIRSGFAIAFADITTGEFTVTEVDGADKPGKVVDELARLSPSEIIMNGRSAAAEQIEAALSVKAEVYNLWAFDYDNAFKKLTSHFKVLNLNGFGLEDSRRSVCAAGALLSYLSETQKNSLSHIIKIQPYRREGYMIIDANSRKNLEITRLMREKSNEKSKNGTLFWTLNNTKTAMGARLLRKWLEQPLVDVDKIKARQEAVSEYKSDPLTRADLRDILTTVQDLERICSKLVYATANARDLTAIKNSVVGINKIKALLNKYSGKVNFNFSKELDPLSDIYEMIDKAIVPNPPVSIREGGFIRDSFDGELDKFRYAKNNGSNWLLELEAREKEATGIKNLKIKYNKIFGYFFEVTSSYQSLVPERFIRRQTLANCERYTTEEIKEIESAILSADSQIVEIEYNIFVELREKITAEIGRILETANILAEIDVFQSFAEAADKNNYSCPEVNNGSTIKIKNGRHPVVELMTDKPFVPNDAELDAEDNRLAIITGPNMAGKSTYMRQVALLVLLAQTGSFIPADSALIGVVDRIFTRVGASDDLASGQSTFMVEMSEMANILNNATKDSLIIVDEVGRGTSTMDGLSIAWSIMEYIADKDILGAKTLFSTHYHELTELEGKIGGVVNYCFNVREEDGNVVFLRKVMRGGINKSYGIHVASLAGTPERIIKRAKEILNLLDEEEVTKRAVRENGADKVVHYGKRKRSDGGEILIKEFETLDIDALTPRDALKKLYEFKEIASAAVKSLYGE